MATTISPRSAVVLAPDCADVAVAVADGGLDHPVTHDSQREQLAFADEMPRQRQ
ncbi:hypothetical protein ACWGIN_31195 [Streptomyces sp. NPDC054861]